ncbi:hypothetical protein GQ457_15G015160 [Hibiscus cannabinus]
MKIDNLSDDNYNDYLTIEIYTEQEQPESKVDDGKHIDNGKTIDYFIAEDTWDKIDKELKDYNENDMDMLRWKSLEYRIEFYHTYAKVVGFEVRIGKTVKSRTDGHIISKTLCVVSRVIGRQSGTTYLIGNVNQNNNRSIDYKTFGQVLAFDTTYKCNAYNKTFVALVGVNHHRNKMPFICALVVNEKEDTYVWVLQKLITTGDGYKLLTVITNGDKVMANVIAQVIPEAKHRLCLWHLMRNVKKW